MSETTVRALRTAAQNLLFDALVLIVAVLVPAIQDDATNWALVWSSLVKTVAVTVLSAVHKFVETHRPA